MISFEIIKFDRSSGSLVDEIKLPGLSPDQVVDVLSLQSVDEALYVHLIEEEAATYFKSRFSVSFDFENYIYELTAYDE